MKCYTLQGELMQCWYGQVMSHRCWRRRCSTHHTIFGTLCAGSHKMCCWKFLQQGKVKETKTYFISIQYWCNDLMWLLYYKLCISKEEVIPTCCHQTFSSTIMMYCTCLPKTNWQWHPDQTTRVLQPVLQRLLYELHRACLVPDGQLQGLHATDDPFLLFFCQKTTLLRHVNHVWHIDVDRLAMQQRWKNFLHGKEKCDNVKIWYVSERGLIQH